MEEDITIIGAGFAGLAAGIYAQMNGYRTQIFEMYDLPGGLCTAWKRTLSTVAFTGWSVPLPKAVCITIGRRSALPRRTSSST
ncbi:MAG: NAD(P)-binding protein [Anaerolineae bacterium]